MEDEENIIEMIRTNAYKTYEELKTQTKISDNVLQVILEQSDNRIFQGIFLEEFEYFTSYQLHMIEKFIHQHINNRNCLFVSSLIGCANFNHILSFHDICIEFIKRKRNNFVVLSALDYLFEHMNFHDIGRIVTTFNRVLNNKKYYQNCQTIASFYLFRITHHQKYYDFLKSLILDGDEINYLVLKNSLQGMDYNKKRYFAYYEDLMTIIKNKEKRLAVS